MRRILLISVLGISVFAGCRIQHTYASFTDWDSNDDRMLHRDEFISAYSQSRYFTKWSDTQGPIPYDVVYRIIFKRVDSDSSRVIDYREFYKGINNFYFKVTGSTFTEWDTNASGSLDPGEFNRHIGKTGFAEAWDRNADQLISQHEMANGMFDACDVNHNTLLDEPEFDLWDWFR